MPGNPLAPPLIVLATSAPKSDNNEQVVIGNRSSFKSCGPVASMSRQDWAKKLVHRKTEFVDTLKLGVDMDDDWVGLVSMVEIPLCVFRVSVVVVCSNNPMLLNPCVGVGRGDGPLTFFEGSGSGPLSCYARDYAGLGEQGLEGSGHSGFPNLAHGDSWLGWSSWEDTQGGRVGASWDEGCGGWGRVIVTWGRETARF
ncbi:hypothetical protein Tco_0226060 [Tanacetum coccineum]